MCGSGAKGNALEKEAPQNPAGTTDEDDEGVVKWTSSSYRKSEKSLRVLQMNKMDHNDDLYNNRAGRRGRTPVAERPASSSAGEGKRSTGKKLTRSRESVPQPQSPSYNTMSENDFLEQSKIHQVLNAFKDDVVRIKSSEKNKWRESVSALSVRDEILQQQPHENIPRDEVGDRPSAWKINFQKNKSKSMHFAEEKSETRNTNKTSLESIPEISSDSSASQAIDPSIIESAQLLKCFALSSRASFYCSGILAGLLISRAWFESFEVFEVNWASGPVFSTFLWSTTTILILFTVIGFMNRVDTVNEDVTDLRNVLLHLIPVLAILISHYLNQSFQLQRKECLEYFKMNEKVGNKVHLTETTSCDAYRKGKTDVVLVFLRIVPAVTAFGLYTYIHFWKNNSLLTKMESSIFPNGKSDR